MKKRVLSVLLAIVMVVGLFPVTAGATAAPVETWNIGAPESGYTATDAVVAKLYNNAEDDTKYDLVISGTGKMASTIGTSMPWTSDSEYQERIVSVIVESDVTNVESYAFKDCTALTSVTLGDTVTEIGNYAFKDCTALTSVTLGNTVAEIGSYAFSGCTSLTGVTIPASTTSIASSAFGGCTSLTAYTVDNGNTAYSATDGILFSKDGTTLVSYPSNKIGTSYIVPDSVTKISSNAFCYVTNLTELTIPHTTTTIVGAIFYDKVVEEKITINGHTGSAAEAYTKFDTDSTTFVSICSDGDDADTLCDVCGYDTHPVCGEVCTHDTDPNTDGVQPEHATVTWKAWDSTTSLPTEPGNYYLTGNVTLGSAWSTPAGNIAIDLKGHTITVSADDKVINVNSGTTLSITDTVGGGSVSITARKEEGTYSIYNSGGTVDLYGGTVCATGEEYNMYGIYNASGSVSVSDGAKVDGKTGGIRNYGTVTVSGGTVVGGGEGIMNAQNSTVNITGGEVKGANSGSFAINNSGTLTVSAPGKVEGYEGGIRNYTGAEATISGGTVTGKMYGILNDGTATVSGGKVVGGADSATHNCYGIMNEGTVTVSGGTVQGGHYAAKSPCYGIYNAESGSAIVSGGGVDALNYQSSESESVFGIYNLGAVTVSSGTVKGRDRGGSGAYTYGIWNGGSLNLSGDPTISGEGVDIYLSTSKVITINGELNFTASAQVISVKMDAPGTFTTGWTRNMVGNAANYGSYFTSANDGYTVQPDGSELKLAEPPATISVTDVSLSESSLTLDVGDTAELTATISPNNATDKTVSWTSSAPTVATVVDGVVTAVAPGTATITATTTDGGKTATCTVTVNKIAITGTIAITTTQEPTVGQTFDLNCIVIPTGNYSYTAKAIAPNASIEAGKNYILSVGLKPNDGYYFADNITATVNGKNATIYRNGDNISINYTYSFAAPKADSVDILLSGISADTAPVVLPGVEQNDVVLPFTAKVLDQYGQEMTGQTVEWSITGTNTTGISVNNGALTVSKDAAVGNYTLTATCDGKSDSITIKVEKAESVAASVAITGTQIITIPETGSTAVEGYTVKILDQYGDEIENAVYDYGIYLGESSGGAREDVTYDPNTGAVTVKSSAAAGEYIFKVTCTYVDENDNDVDVIGRLQITLVALEAQTITCANVTGTYGQTEELKLNPSGKQTAGAYGFAIKSGASTDVVEVASDGKLTIKNAGETTIVVTAPGDATHASASVEVNVTIYKADITEYTEPTSKDLTYNGSAQALITGGSALGGNMMYAIGTAEQVTGEWSTDTPTGTDIGTYYVWYKIVGDGNHNNKTFETPITVTIAPNTYIVTYLPGINGTGTQTTDTKTQGVVLTLRGAIFTRTGYTQTGWATTDGGNQAYALGASYTADAPITLYPVWTANTNTAYTVEHWQQNVEQTDYVKVDTDEKTGTTGAETVAAAKTYTGFTAQSFNQVAIAADGGTVVKIYYNRNTYTVTYTDNGVFLSNVTFEDVVYGAKAPTYPGTATRPGYTFGGWYKDSGLTTIWNFENDTINGPTTIYAKWTEKNAVSITETAQTYTWDGNPKSFAITGTPNTGFTVQYKVNGNWTTTAPSAVGTYDVKITRAEDDTYKAYEKIITGGLVINAATPTATAPTAKTSLVYDGNAQFLIEASTSEHGHWEYSLDGTSYSSDIPTGTDAKTYTVYCRFVPNTGYAGIDPVERSVTIAPKEVAEPTVVGTYTYTGSEQTVTLDGVLGCMTVSGNKATHAGDYEVSIALDGNHKWNAASDGEIAWSIGAKAVTPTAALEYASIIYSSSERNPIVTLKDGDTVIPSGEYTVSYSNNVNVGTATVTITDKEYGNYTFAEITKTFEIMKDGVSPVVTMDNYVYGGTPAVPNVSGNSGSGTVTVYYSTDSSKVDKLWEDISGTTLNVGTYYMKAHVAATDNYAEGISPVITFKVTPGKYAAPSAPTASEFTVTINEADRGKILEYSLDGTNWINVPVLTNGTFELKGLSESTRYTVYLRVKASSDGNYQASDAVSTVWTTPARYSVAYHANLGTGNIPASVTQNSGRSVTVARGSGLKRTGYTFAGWNTAANGNGTDYAPGSTISTGATLYAKWTANSYTVKFKANGGSGTMDDQNFTYDVTQALTENAFTRDGYHFAGWALSSGNTAIYMDGQTVKNLSDKGTVTLHAVWAEDVYNIGADFSSDSNHQIIAKLMRGDAQIGSAQSVTMSGNGAPYIGHFDFTGVPKGIYNIVAEQYGKVITKLIIITDHDDTVEITMPASKVNSVLEVSEDALPVVVGGLEDEAATKAEESKTVTITMTVEKQEEQQLPDNASESEKATQEAIAEIKEEASSKTFEFMDIEVEKTVEEAGQADVSEKLTETNKVMEIVIPFDLTGKRGITVYRHHNGQTEPFAENTTKADGTFYIDEVNHLIHVFSRKFSTYAIGYTEPAPYHPPVVSVHSCTSKCDVCGGCEDAKCTQSACKDKCLLLGMNFTDVADGKWYTEPVAYVYHHGMMEGVGNNLFDINGTTTRAMIVTILWRLEGEPVVNYLMQFEDVPAEQWYTEAVRWAASEKIVEGYSDTAFGPTDPITREQFATILWRYAKYKGYDVSVGEDTNILSYEDAFSISEYAIPAMQWACGAGLMQGDGVNLTPKADATRSQAAALFQRFCENVAEK